MYLPFQIVDKVIMIKKKVSDSNAKFNNHNIIKSRANNVSIRSILLNKDYLKFGQGIALALKCTEMV